MAISGDNQTFFYGLINWYQDSKALLLFKKVGRHTKAVSAFMTQKRQDWLHFEAFVNIV